MRKIPLALDEVLAFLLVEIIPDDTTLPFGLKLDLLSCARILCIVSAESEDFIRETSVLEVMDTPYRRRQSSNPVISCHVCVLLSPVGH